MTETIFFRLLADDDKAAGLSAAVEELREDGGAPDVYQADSASLRQVPSTTSLDRGQTLESRWISRK
jgi:hypothetical protein